VSPVEVVMVLLLFLVPLYILLVTISEEEAAGRGVKGGESAPEQEMPAASVESRAPQSAVSSDPGTAHRDA
jgi:hypothetical protein